MYLIHNESMIDAENIEVSVSESLRLKFGRIKKERFGDN